MMDGRRTMSFSSLAEVMPEVDRLLAGHRTVGHWTLGQICNHLSGGIIGSVDGFPGRLPWIVRKTIGPLIVRSILKTGRMREGVKLPDPYRPKPGVDARAEAESLRAAIRFFGTHAGPFADHPLSGPLTRENWERLHCIHCAHHLSFALPESVGVA
jgi:Protein of unknown function (DUF1569)